MQKYQKTNNIPLLGDDFPELTVQTTEGVMELPQSFKGKWFILFSHPADFTPVCTTEFVAFQKKYDQFKELDCELIGLSIDQVFAHLKWKEWINKNLNVEIEFPIIADTGAVAETLGIIHPNKGTNTVRAVFFVDNNAKIRTILYYPQELGRNLEEILRILKGLQTVDSEHVSLPANWPNNEIIDDHVIVPATPSKNIIEERFKEAEKGEFTCIDWWLCHKKLE
jgi:peroxiredoxin (alkyl hydroperoxide reductase subunit C)